MDTVEKHVLFENSGKTQMGLRVKERKMNPQKRDVIHAGASGAGCMRTKMWIKITFKAKKAWQKCKISLFCIFMHRIHPYAWEFIHTFHWVWMIVHRFYPQRVDKPKNGRSKAFLEAGMRKPRTKKQVIPKLCNTCG